MDVVIPKAGLKAVAEHAGAVINRASTIPVWAMLHLAADASGFVTASGIGTPVSARARTTAGVRRSGQVCVAPDRFVQAVGAMPDEDITIGMDKSFLRITAGRRKVALATLPGEDYPALEFAGGTRCEVPATDLRYVIARTLPAVSDDATRPHLCCIYLTGEGDTIRAVSTDGHRLAVAARPAPGVGTWSALVPSEMAGLLPGLLASDGKVTLFRSTGPAGGTTIHALTVHVGDRILSTKTIDALFPSYDQVIPAPGHSTVRVGVKELREGLRTIQTARHTPTAKERCEGVTSLGAKFRLRAEGIHLQSEHVGEVETEDMVDGLGSGPELLFGLNVHYLESFLPTMRGDITINGSGKLDPVRIGDTDDSAFVGVIMPMRI